MSELVTHTLNGTAYTPPEEARDISILATWDQDSVEANITVGDLTFVNDAKEAIDNWLNSLPTEGMPYTPVISDGTITISQKYYLNFFDHLEHSAVKCTVTAQKDNGLPSLDDRASGLTMQLLKSKGILTSADWVRVPYVVENRKRLLEFLTMQIQLYNIAKSIYDEVFKLVNIVSDLFSGLWFTTAGAAIVAIANLVATLTNLVLLTIQLVKLLKDMQEVISPMVRYHYGINIKNWIVKALAYMGYDFQTNPDFEWVLDRVTLVGSKNDQVGKLAAAVELGDLFHPSESPGSGILSPNDFGYTLGETFELLNKFADTKVGVKGNVVHIRPENDPFWISSASFVFPDVKIENHGTKATGTKRRNYEEQYSHITVSYAKDNSDLHTLTNRNSSFAEFAQFADTVSDQKHLNIRGLQRNDIPYSLCVRKDASDKLFGFFEKLEELYTTMQGVLQEVYDNNPELIGHKALPDLLDFIGAVFVRAGSMKVENHFFSTPKIVFLDPVTGRIPKDYVDHIGADALFTKYHSYKAFAQGFKNPAKPFETNQKFIYEGVVIPFGIDSYQDTINNPYFSFEGGKLGKFISLKWDIERDRALCDFYVFDNWNNNIKGELRDFSDEIGDEAGLTG